MVLFFPYIISEKSIGAGAKRDKRPVVDKTINTTDKKNQRDQLRSDTVGF